MHKSQNDSIVDLESLMKWYRDQCDGDWEHCYGISIGTLDNPGWRLSADLKNTPLEDSTMDVVSEGCDPNDDDYWIHCHVVDNGFEGACDPGQLPRLIRIFDSFRKKNEKVTT